MNMRGRFGGKRRTWIRLWNKQKCSIFHFLLPLVGLLCWFTAQPVPAQPTTHIPRDPFHLFHSCLRVGHPASSAHRIYYWCTTSEWKGGKEATLMSACAASFTLLSRWLCCVSRLGDLWPPTSEVRLAVTWENHNNCVLPPPAIQSSHMLSGKYCDMNSPFPLLSVSLLTARPQTLHLLRTKNVTYDTSCWNWNNFPSSHLNPMLLSGSFPRPLCQMLYSHGTLCTAFKIYGKTQQCQSTACILIFHSFKYQSLSSSAGLQQRPANRRAFAAVFI